MRNHLLALCGAALLAGCADISPVAFEMPVSRLDIPERTAGVAHFETGVGGGNYVTLTPNQVTTAPDPQHPQFGNCPEARDDNGFVDTSNMHCSGGSFIRGDARLGDYVQLGVRRSWDMLAVVQAKVYLLGPKAGHAKPGDNSLAMTLGYGWDHNSTSGSDDTQSPSQSGRTELKRHLVDTALIYGHRWQKWLMGYAGAYYNDHGYSGTYEHSSGSQRTTTAFDGSAHMVGFNAGLKFDFGTDVVGGILECAFAHVYGGNNADTVDRCAVGVEVTFGGRSEEVAPAARQAPPRNARPAPKR